MSTIQSICNRARDSYPNLTEANALIYLNEKLAEIFPSYGLRQKSTTINLTAGTQDYDLPAGCGRIHSAELWTSASSYVTLTPTSADHKDAFEDDWRGDASRGNPDQYMVLSVPSGNNTKMVLRLRPIPSVTTSAGYPVVILYWTERQDLTVMENTPPEIGNPSFLIDWICYQHTCRREPAKSEKHLADFERGLARWTAQQNNFVKGDQGIQIAFPGIASVRVE